MSDRRDPPRVPGRPDSGGGARVHRLSRRERLGEWIECVLDFGDALDVAEIQPVLDEGGAASAAPARIGARG